MKQFKHKCVVTKNGTKMYYKRVDNKWKRISNKLGQKAEKGKKKYKINKNEELCESLLNINIDEKSHNEKREIIHKALVEKYGNINLLDNEKIGVQFIDDMFKLYNEHPRSCNLFA